MSYVSSNVFLLAFNYLLLSTRTNCIDAFTIKVQSKLISRNKWNSGIHPWRSNTAIHHSSTSSSSSSTPNPTSGGENNDDIREMLQKMTCYFSSMVDDSTGRFYALSYPQSGERVHEHCPIRDLGSSWDATTVLLFWKDGLEGWRNDQQQQQWKLVLEMAVCRTLEFYMSSCSSVIVDPLDEKSSIDERAAVAGLALDSKILLEPSNVAHSGFFLLTSIGALRLSLLNNISSFPTTTTTASLSLLPFDGLTKGILSMQRHDGAFRILFFGEKDDERSVYKGIEFYPGEAMVALMEMYQFAKRSDTMDGLILEESTRQAILPAMTRAFSFYSEFYYGGNVDANYNIWQVQAFSRLYHVLYEIETSDGNSGSTNNHGVTSAIVAKYVLDLCQGIVESRSWKELARGQSFYPNLQTVEIACGLDAIAEGISVLGDKVYRDNEYAMKMSLYWRHVDNAVDYLKHVQDQVPLEAAVGSGGLGYGGIQVLEQRLDVTGHAVSALTKLCHLRDSGQT